MFALLSQKIKIKNIKIALLVFSGLCVLSFGFFSSADDRNASNANIFQDSDQDGLSNEEEKLYKTDPNNTDTDSDGYSDGTEVKSGYNPLKPAPGDKITTVADIEEQQSIALQETIANKTNLTQEVSKQVADTIKESSSDQKNISLEDLKSTVQQTIDENTTVDALPDIDVKSIKIKKQKYENLSEIDRTAKIKDDTLKYTTAVSYILVNNSPVSLRSDSDVQKLASNVMTNVVEMVSGGNSTLLEDISNKGTLITDQLKDVTVPENMLDMHIKALRLAQYATTLKKDVQSTDINDPLSQINSLAKVQGFISLFSGFTSDMNDILTNYDIQITL
jgi:hypothetical protein